MKSKITKEELEAISAYQNEKNQMMKQLLVQDVEKDIALLENQQVEYSKEQVVENINQLKLIYTAIVRNFYENSKPENNIFYQLASMAEVKRWKVNSSFPYFWFVSTAKEEAEKKLANSSSKQVMLQIERKQQVPYVLLDKKDALLVPFTKIVWGQEDEEHLEIALEAEEFETLSKDENEKCYGTILKGADEVNEILKACCEFDNENAIHYENIRKLEQLLANHHLAMEQENYEQDTTDAEKQSNLDDIARINLELTSLKDMTAKICKIRQENVDFIANWKKEVSTYLKDEFRQIQEKYKAETSKEEESEEIQEPNLPKKELDPAVAEVKTEILENIAVVGTLLNNIKDLIAKQQNHARIAEAIDSNYKALNNAFEMKNFAEELEALLQAMSNKMDTMSSEDEEELEKMSKTNIQVSVLLNYLNNAKAAVGKKITRFDEISIIEENELKKEIAETIKNIRCEAELKKLRDDIDIIEDKSKWKKWIGKFTGRNRMDEIMLDQIQVRQTAIKKTFKAKMPLSYNYSIHELIAEIEMFIQENEEDELVAEDVSVLRKIKDVLKKNFVIIDSKVVSIVDQKTGKNLPMASKKMTKKELIEIDTYRFLNRYGYDKARDTNEPEYQDTLANEIKRIVDYIKTSGVI